MSKLAEAMLKAFPGKCSVIKIKMLHETVVRNYIMGIEEEHDKAAKSKLTFK